MNKFIDFNSTTFSESILQIKRFTIDGESSHSIIATFHATINKISKSKDWASHDIENYIISIRISILFYKIRSINLEFYNSKIISIKITHYF